MSTVVDGPLAGRRVLGARHRVRRWAALAVAGSATVSLVSAVTPPLRGRLRFLLDAVPIGLPQLASTALVFASVALLLVGRGLRRGHRHAWVLALVLLVATAALNLVKGVDVEEAVVAVAVAGWLVVQHRHFAVLADRRSLQRAAAAALAMPVVAVTVSVALVVIVGRGNSQSLRETVQASVERMVGDRLLPLSAAASFLSPALLAAGLVTVVAVGWLAFAPSPVVAIPTTEERERARAVVVRHGADTLAYFALRDDKSYLFSGHSVVAYAVHNGVCLVAPDPIGPPDEREDVLLDLLDMADRDGWSVAVVGASPEWLPTYEAVGMKAIYMGDEAILDCRTFTLDGGAMKSLRGAYNRVCRHGFTVTFHDPADLDEATRAELRDLMTETRRGEAERGFSMTLSRVFDESDRGLLLAVARDAEGRAAAFCQYVPAPGIGGYSLDLMRRRADPDLPNGVTDVVVIETALHLRALGYSGLALNFAVLREVVAGERDGRFAGTQRKVLLRLSDSMQIESLWRYNEKFRPTWRPRYVVTDAVEHLAAQSVAIAEAESIWEMPVLGRLWRPETAAVGR